MALRAALGFAARPLAVVGRRQVCARQPDLHARSRSLMRIGIAETANSVPLGVEAPPRAADQTRLRSTPTRRAIQKCPYSWTATRMPIATRNATMYPRIVMPVAAPTSIDSASPRRPSSASSTTTSSPSCRSSTPSTTSGIRTKPRRPARKAVPPPHSRRSVWPASATDSAAARASLSAGTARHRPALRSRGRAAATRSSDSTPEAIRSGQPSGTARSACACPDRPSCARIEPSTYSTSECTMLCGCTTTFAGSRAEHR